MRLISAISLGSVGVLLVGCTLIQISHYLSPTAPGGISSRHPLGGDVAAIYSGPPNFLQLETDSLRLGFSCRNEGYTTLLAGPLLFPVFPIVVFSFSPIVRKPLKTDRLEIALEIEPMRQPLRFTPGKVEIEDATGVPLRAREIWYRGRKLSAKDTVTVTKPMLFVLEFEAASEAGRSRFQVTVNGVTVSGSSVVLPPIEVAPGNGLELQMAP
jgi:hypothetical protein